MEMETYFPSNPLHYVDQKIHYNIEPISFVSFYVKNCLLFTMFTVTFA